MLIENVKKLIKNEDKILLISPSKLVEKALIDSKADNKNFTVYLLDEYLSD